MNIKTNQNVVKLVGYYFFGFLYRLLEVTNSKNGDNLANKTSQNR